jgi:hypothetical protein
VTCLAQFINIEITYELNKKDFVDAVKLHRNRSAFTKWLPGTLACIALVLAGVSLLQLASCPDNQTLSNYAPLFVLAAVWAALIFGSPWLIAKRLFGKQPSLRGRRTILLDTAGVHLRWSGGTSDLQWNNFTRQLEDKNQFLLYTSPVLFTVVPKRGFTPEQLTEFRTILAQNVPKQ